jgi:hypothetical protein
LGVSRHRRRSRPSSSPERPCSSSPSTSGRLPRLRRQSTTLDEGKLRIIQVAVDNGFVKMVPE